MFQGNRILRWIYVFVVAAFTLFAFSVIFKRFFEESRSASIVAAPSAEMSGDLLAYERNTIDVFQQASSAVVFVHNLQKRREFFSFNVTEVQAGTGSGFLWDGKGHIVTNYHVVQGATRVAVTLIDGKTYNADIVGAEPRKDMAILKIDLRKTNVIPFGEKVSNSAEVLVGQKAIAIGNPYGLDHTLTVGNVSALSRSMPSVMEGVTIRDMIQTDAPINPGNSGGPLLDSRGRLIGMNTMILRNSTGIGFAVPSNTIKRIVNQIIQYGRPVQLGIGIEIFEDRITQSIGVEGVVLREVYSDSPAEKAGLKGTSRDQYGRIILGDIIVSIDGDPIRNYDDMYNAFDEKKAGSNVVLVFLRNGEERTETIDVVTVTD
ncbi:MAG: trypsin-like serine protease [Opitutales bacterium]|jgi:S1-C subfamily serine protease|nr:trypsin-like serine protease [Opitutales bacterium]MDG2253561.1 trypsin-like peptidase domain-containing protein [Opitutaceae bacterium]MBT5168795.1 trypsin-like serine protease [Opitutales bacterium]MBT5816643.1 trypsin-like serine protease [Opitutales bacterium]MBT6378831.1 trypsin-like serine protease [Opitutales bacterium]